jgi:hypothetical protein
LTQHIVLALKSFYYQHDRDTVTSESVASTFLTVSTSVIVTGLITFRLLRARRDLVKVLPSADVRVYTGVIAILIEPAAPLTIFGIIAAILQQLGGSPLSNSPRFHVLANLFQGLFYSFCVSSNNQQMPFC